MDAEQFSETFLRGRRELMRCETPKGAVVFGYIGPKTSDPPELRLSDFLSAFMEICKSNMEELYNAVWGWSDRENLDQLSMDHSHFFVAFREGDLTQCIGFCQLVPEWYYERPVMYLYEIQLQRAHRRMGIGQHLMQLAETMTEELKLEALVLTCMKENAEGMQFYSKLGYAVDPSSPESETAAKYEILSKSFGANK